MTAWRRFVQVQPREDAMEKSQRREMDKGELIARVADECGLSHHATGQVVESVLNVLSDALAAEGGIRLEGFGTFSAAQKPAPGMAQMPWPGFLYPPTGQAIRFQAASPMVDCQRSSD